MNISLQIDIYQKIYIKNANQSEDSDVPQSIRQIFLQFSKKTSQKVLTNGILCGIIYESCGGIAQLARALGSYPNGRWFKSDFRYQARWSSG